VGGQLSGQLNQPIRRRHPRLAHLVVRNRELNSQLSPISTCIGYRPSKWSFYPEWTGSRDSFKAEIAKFLQINQTVLVKRIYTKLKNDADGENPYNELNWANEKRHYYKNN